MFGLFNFFSRFLWLANTSDKNLAFLVLFYIIDFPYSMRILKNAHNFIFKFLGLLPTTKSCLKQQQQQQN